MRLSRAMKPSDLGRSGSGAWWVVVGRGALDRRGGFAVVEVCHGGFDVVG